MNEPPPERPNTVGAWPELFPSAPAVDFGDIPAPTSWQQLRADDAAKQWTELRAWVDQLRDRFEYLDHHVVPACWWQHNQLVEALVALRDHERSSYADTSPAAAPVDWFRALRDITLLLRAWTTDTGCGATHQATTAPLRPSDTDSWERFVAEDVAHRRAVQADSDATNRSEARPPHG